MISVIGLGNAASSIVENFKSQKNQFDKFYLKQSLRKQMQNLITSIL